MKSIAHSTDIARGVTAANDFRFDTHWTRFLYRDLDSSDHDSDTDNVMTFETAGPDRTPATPGDDTVGRRFRTPLTAAAALLCLYAAMHLAVGGFLHMLEAPYAHAAHPGESVIGQAAADRDDGNPHSSPTQRGETHVQRP